MLPPLGTLRVHTVPFLGVLGGGRARSLPKLSPVGGQRVVGCVLSVSSRSASNFSTVGFFTFCFGDAPFAQEWAPNIFGPIRTNLRTQSPIRRATLEELGGIGMFLTLVHLATGTHATLDGLENRAKRVVT